MRKGRKTWRLKPEGHDGGRSQPVRTNLRLDLSVLGTATLAGITGPLAHWLFNWRYKSTMEALTTWGNGGGAAA